MHRLEKENDNQSQRVKFEQDGGYSRVSIRQTSPNIFEQSNINEKKRQYPNTDIAQGRRQLVMNYTETSNSPKIPKVLSYQSLKQDDHQYEGKSYDQRYQHQDGREARDKRVEPHQDHRRENSGEGHGINTSRSRSIESVSRQHLINNSLKQ